MSDRIPINDAAAAVAANRRRGRPPGPRVATALGEDLAADDLEDFIPASRRDFKRKPFGSQRRKLEYPERPGYHRHWFNDDPNRVNQARDAGYEHVLNEKGEPEYYVVGSAKGGGPLRAYLMEIPLLWFNEDMAAQDAAVLDRLQDIRAGRFENPADPRTGQTMLYRGSAKGDISIREGTRR
jgi:hypothetical protein